MKYLFLIGILSLFFSSRMSGQSAEYLITKIDSTQKVYLISIESKNFKGVVISNKKTCKTFLKRLSIGKKYCLHVLEHPVIRLINLKDLKIKTNNKPEIIIEDVNACELKEDCKVYQIDNLCGLYLIKNK